MLKTAFTGQVASLAGRHHTICSFVCSSYTAVFIELKKQSLQLYLVQGLTWGHMSKYIWLCHILQAGRLRHVLMLQQSISTY